ncbi:hypothetical protein JW926_08810 [Candidatus Sumerlaeota bacterium]|nr:hypothetical protein [Candidatus Sumerlaeota bacterium]
MSLTVLIFLAYGKTGEIAFASFMNLPLVLRINHLSWFFAIAIQTVTTLSVIFSLSYMKGKERVDFYYLMMLLCNSAMLGIVLSGDFVSFYIFWEIMSWSAFLLISYNRGGALYAGMKYIVMSIIGSMCMLIGIMSLYSTYGTLNIREIHDLISTASGEYLLFISILFLAAFGVKSALWPIHVWLPPAHSEAPSPFSAVLSSILIKMGIYGFVLILYVISGAALYLGLGGGSFRYILTLLAAITIIIPTFNALMQDDAKRLLAWSSIAQIGYIILGISIGTSLGLIGGLFHFFNHVAFKALLFLAVGAIEYRTGTRDLNSLGGLIKKMPVTFIAVLAGTFGLIGIPLTNGFVSKWLIYKTLILNNHPFLAFAALVGTWGTILYSYKLIHNIFLGQLPENLEHTKPAPASMKLPFIILSVVIVLFGILPGIPLKLINLITASLGFDLLNINIWGIASESGPLNIINIFAAFAVALIVVWFFFLISGKKVVISQDNSYAAGIDVPKGKYHYTVDFYNPMFRMIKPYFRDYMDEFYSQLVKALASLSDRVRRLYCGDLGVYVIYIVLFLSILVISKIGLNLW